MPKLINQKPSMAEKKRPLAEEKKWVADKRTLIKASFYNNKARDCLLLHMPVVLL